jgi:hypothetical protein
MRPSLLLEEYIGAVVGAPRLEPVRLPRSAASAVRAFLEKAVDRDEPTVDAVAGAASYELAAKTAWLVSGPWQTKADADAFQGDLQQYFTLLKRFIASPTDVGTLTQEEIRTAQAFKEFLRALRRLGQSAASAEAAQCM